MSVVPLLERFSKDFDVNDKDIGTLQSAFIVTFMFLSAVFGYLGDRYSRKNIILFGIFVWQTFIIIGSLLQPIPDNPEDEDTHFSKRTQWNILLFCRAMFGVGEAAYVNIAPAIIDDLFTSKNAKIIALTIFSMAMCVGAGLGYMLAHNILVTTDSWQWAMVSTTFLTIPVGVFYLLFVDDIPHGGEANYENVNFEVVRDDDENDQDQPYFNSMQASGYSTGFYRPPVENNTNNNNNNNPSAIQRDDDKNKNKIIATNPKPKSFIENAQFLVQQKSFYGMVSGQIFMAFVITCLANWIIVYMTRLIDTKPWPIDVQEKEKNRVLNTFGIITIITGVLGGYLGGSFAAYLRKINENRGKSTNTAETLISAGACFLGGISIFAFLVASPYISVTGQLAIHFISLLSGALVWPLVPLMIFQVVLPTQKSFAQGIATTLSHVFGDAFSPTLIGIWSIAFCDKYADDAAKLLPQHKFFCLYQALIALPIVLILAGASFLHSAYFVDQDVKRLKNYLSKRNSLVGSLNQSRSLTNMNQDEDLIED